MNQPDMFQSFVDSQYRAALFNAERAAEVNVQTPAARASDPITSHLAAEQHTQSGARAAQQALTVAAVRAFPGRTSFELALASNHDRYMLARRLPECELAGLVRRGDTKHCSVTGRLALTWSAQP